MTLALRRSSGPGVEAPAARQLPDAARLSVARLRLRNFRNHEHSDLDLDARSVVITGPNGSGKTNLLEAVSFLGAGRGLRAARLGDVTRLGWAGGWTVSAVLATPDGPLRIGTGTETGAGLPDPAGQAAGQIVERRLVRVDGRPASGPAALAGRVAVTWLSPRMDRLFVEAPAGRRAFLDRLTASLVPGHGGHVAAYERAMRARLSLLRNGGGDSGWLTALEATMAEHAIAIAAARREALARLRGGLAAGVGPFPRAEAAVQGLIEDWLETRSALDAEDAFSHRLAELRARDGEAGRTTAGPHRSDLAVHHAAKQLPAARCSTGEQKALLIAIVLAAARVRTAMTGTGPLLLLDEITAHLDDHHRAALFDEISALGVQAWLTGTDRALFGDLIGRAQFLSLRGGKVMPD